MWTASVEANTGEILLVLMPSGEIAGKGLLSFQAPLDLYCWQQVDDQQQLWFSQLDMNLQGKLCELAQLFLGSIYSGDWNYSDDEYEIFKARSTTFPVTEDLFKNGLEKARTAWTNASSLLTDLRVVLEALRASQLNETPCYDPVYTVAELEASVGTISLLVSRNAQEVRLKIE